MINQTQFDDIHWNFWIEAGSQLIPNALLHFSIVLNRCGFILLKLCNLRHTNRIAINAVDAYHVTAGGHHGISPAEGLRHPNGATGRQGGCLAAWNHDCRAITLNNNGLFAVHKGNHLPFNFAHSVEASAFSPFSAELTVCQARLAHLTRAGNLHTPERIVSLPTPLPPCGPFLSASPVSILCTLSKSSLASASVLPFNSAVIIDAEAFEIAQPDPWKLISLITPSSRSR